MSLFDVRIHNQRTVRSMRSVKDWECHSVWAKLCDEKNCHSHRSDRPAFVHWQQVHKVLHSLFSGVTSVETSSCLLR